MERGKKTPELGILLLGRDTIVLVTFNKIAREA